MSDGCADNSGGQNGVCYPVFEFAVIPLPGRSGDFLLLSVVLLLVTLWSPTASRWNKVGLRLVLVAVAVRFALPLIIIGTSLVFDTFLEQEHNAATLALEATTVEVSEISEQSRPPQPATDQSLRDKIGSFLDDSFDRVDVTEKLEQFRDRLSNASEHIINLIVIFIFQTILMPLARAGTSTVPTFRRTSSSRMSISCIPVPEPT